MLPPVPAVAVMVLVFRVKVAVTDLATSIVTEHVPVPVHAPDQPAKVELASGVAVSDAVVPELYGSEQSEPQFIPAGEDVIEPAPVPAFVTLRV
jgi:hypothetical protein